MEQRLFTPLLCEQAPQLRRFEAEVHKNWMVHEKLLSFFGGFKSDAHPMAIMVSVVGALSAFYPDSVNIHDAAQRRLSAIRMAPEMSHGAPCRARTVSSRLTRCEQVAKMPTIAAIAYKTSIGEPVVYPSNALPFAANFLHMMFATPAEPYKVSPVQGRPGPRPERGPFTTPPVNRSTPCTPRRLERETERERERRRTSPARKTVGCSRATPCTTAARRWR